MIKKGISEKSRVSSLSSTAIVSIIPKESLSDEDITGHFNTPSLESPDDVPEAFRMAESEEEEEQKSASSENSGLNLELEKSDCQLLEVKRVSLDGDLAEEPEFSMQQTPRSVEFHFLAGDRIIESESEEKESSDEDYDPSQDSLQLIHTHSASPDREPEPQSQGLLFSGDTTRNITTVLDQTKESIMHLVASSFPSFQETPLEKKNPSPPPQKIEWFTVIGKHGITLRKGEKLESTLLGTLARNTIVHVVGKKGRRIKIDYPKEGWISLQSADGKTRFLKPCDPPEEEDDDPMQKLIEEIERLRDANSSLDNILSLKDKKIDEIEKELYELENHKLNILELVEALRVCSIELRQEEKICKTCWNTHDRIVRDLTKQNYALKVQNKKILHVEKETKEMKTLLQEQTLNISNELNTREEKAENLENAEEIMLEMKTSCEELKSKIATMSEQMAQVDSELFEKTKEIKEFDEELRRSQKQKDKQNKEYHRLNSDLDEMREKKNKILEHVKSIQSASKKKVAESRI